MGDVYWTVSAGTSLLVMLDNVRCLTIDLSLLVLTTGPIATSLQILEAGATEQPPSTDSIFRLQVHEASGRRYANAQSHAWASLTHPEDSSSCATAVLRASGRVKRTTRGSTGGWSCRLGVPLVLRIDSTAMATEETAQDRAIPLDQGPLLGWPSSFRSFLGSPYGFRGGYGGREASLA